MFVRIGREGDLVLTVSNRDIKNALQVFCRDKDVKVRGLVVVLTSDEVQTRYNNLFLGHNYNTDVITQQYDSPLGVLVEMYINGCTTFMETNEHPLRYLLRMVFHGLLHVTGYNDKTDNERIKMREEENRLLQLFHVEHKPQWA